MDFTCYAISFIDKYSLPITPLCNGIIPSMNLFFGIYQPNKLHPGLAEESIQDILPNNNTVNFLS